MAIVLAAILLPVALSAAWGFVGARTFLLLVPLAVSCGWALRAVADLPTGADSTVALDQSLRLLTGAAIVLFVLWGRTLLPLWRVGLAFGAGSLATSLLTHAAYGPTGYKFYFTAPLAIIGFSLADRYGRWRVTAGAAVLLGVFGILDDARSYMSYCVLTAVLIAWQATRARSSRRMSRLTPALLIAALGLAIYFIGSNLLTSGLLGSNLQTESVTQINAAGSLIGGGRPEGAAAIALFHAHPLGYGVGVLPGFTDIMAAKKALAGVGLQVNGNGYVDNYMFGTGLNLHSVISDLWGEFGLVGLLLAGFAMVMVIANLSRLLASRSAGGLVIYQSLVALWVLPFGPLFTNWSDVCLALGLTLAVRSGSGSESESGSESRGRGLRPNSAIDQPQTSH